MNAKAVVNEFAKMRHLEVGLIAGLMMIAIIGMALMGIISTIDFDPDATSAWYALLAGTSLGTSLVSPLLLAVLASRQTDIEHQGNGWLAQATSGLTPGEVCRAKFTALGLIVAMVTVGANLLVLVVGKLLAGILAPIPVGHWFGFTACMVVINLVILALHILLSAKAENQLIALGIGALGTLLAVFSRGLPDVFAHVTPWGFYSLAEAANYEGTGVTALPISYPSIGALAVIAAVLFVLITSRFDRQEA